jgi:hypothetical protein
MAEGATRETWEYFGREFHCDACVDEVKKAKRELANLIRGSERLGGSRSEAMPLMFNVGQPQRGYGGMMVSYPPDKEAHGTRL